MQVFKSNPNRKQTMYKTARRPTANYNRKKTATAINYNRKKMQR